MASIPKVVSWSKMVVKDPDITYMFQAGSRKDKKAHSRYLSSNISNCKEKLVNVFIYLDTSLLAMKLVHYKEKRIDAR